MNGLLIGALKFRTTVGDWTAGAEAGTLPAATTDGSFKGDCSGVFSFGDGDDGSGCGGGGGG